MKSDNQLQHVLYSSRYRSEADWEIIKNFCLARHCRVGFFTPEFSDTGITAPDFISWAMNGFAPGEIALHEGKVVLIGKTTVREAHIIADLTGDSYVECDYLADHSSLSKMSPDLQKTYHRSLSLKGLEYCRKTDRIRPKFIPQVNDRIKFYNSDAEFIGVVRSINVDLDEVELYCWYCYTDRKIGYSMHEKDVCNVHDFHFEIMDVVSQRRLDSELNKCGKTWYERLHRVEALDCRVKKGEPYWYIDDKMVIRKAVEKQTLTSDFRYRAGNYFKDIDTALECMGKISDILRDHMI